MDTKLDVSTLQALPEVLDKVLYLDRILSSLMTPNPNKDQGLLVLFDSIRIVHIIYELKPGELNQNKSDLKFKSLST